MNRDRREFLREAQAEYRRWEDSLEGVAYWLGDLLVQESLVPVIVEAIHKLPREVREFIYFNCRFASMDDGGVRMRRIPQARHPWLITLGEGLVDESLLVHEIAHAWLGHEYDPLRGELQASQRDEEDARDLIRQWGFGGGGKDCPPHVR